MKCKFIFSVIVSLLMFTFSLVLLGLNHNTDMFMEYEAMIDMLCMLLFGISSLVFLREGRVKVLEKSGAKF